LEPATHTYFVDVGSANFYGITLDDYFVSPFCHSILPCFS
ncbi:branched chain amino acid aminotransferase, partial [Listeria monocytogenes]